MAAVLYKRIYAVGVGTHADERRVMLLLSARSALISKRAGLTRDEAELFAEGVLEGLRVAAQGYTLDDAEFSDSETSPLSWHFEQQPSH